LQKKFQERKKLNSFLLRDGTSSEPSRFILEICLYNIQFDQRVPCEDIDMALNYVSNLLANSNLFVAVNKSRKCDYPSAKNKVEKDYIKEEKKGNTRDEKRRKQREKEAKKKTDLAEPLKSN